MLVVRLLSYATAVFSAAVIGWYYYLLFIIYSYCIELKAMAMDIF
jgi:hypothetical protein